MTTNPAANTNRAVMVALGTTRGETLSSPMRSGRGSSWREPARPIRRITLRSKPSMMRSAATVPVALQPESLPFSRTSAGRTNSPARTGKIRMAAKPTKEVYSSFLVGTTWIGSSRNFQRHARSTLTTVHAPMYANSVHHSKRARACFAGRKGSAPARSNHTKITATTSETRTLTRWALIHEMNVPVTVASYLPGFEVVRCETIARALPDRTLLRSNPWQRAAQLCPWADARHCKLRHTCLVRATAWQLDAACGHTSQ